MKNATAKLKYARVAPRKARRIVDMIRGLPVKEAEAQLKLSPRRAGSPVLKLLRGVVANAKNNGRVEEKLFIKEIKVDGGPTLKRWMQRARGSASPVMKRTSHITIVVEESEKIKQPNYVFTKPEKKKTPESPKRGKEEKRARLAEASAKRAEKEVEGKKIEKTGGEKRRFFRRKSV